MLSFTWHELYRAGEPASLARTGIDSPHKAEYAMSAAECAAQLDALLSTGLSIGLVQAEPDLVITFDDGGISNEELAWGLLRARGLRAHFFVCTGLVGRAGFLGPRELRELAEEGNGIGSHGHSHLALPGLTEHALRAELARSKAELEQLLGQPCTTLSLPFGARSERVLGAIWEAGFETVFTSGLPTGERGPVVGRYSVRASWSPGLLRALACGEPLTTAYVRGRYAGSALLGRMQRRLLPSLVRPPAAPLG
ncbi:MAG TPA: polysaccharide deacetylase family protein [Aggregicoccus sp.]|nr:polysaccharide deacetylase family protein [Aggregicoccus sp.]